MSPKWLFARRYLLSRKSHSVINIIASVSLVAVAVPVAAMVVLMSVFNGFEALVRQTYEAVDADVELRAAAGAQPQRLHPTAENRGRIASVEGVAALSFILERQALLVSGGRQTTALLRGVDEHYTDVVPIDNYTQVGNASVRWGEHDRILLGSGTAYALGVWSVVGRSVTAYAIGGGAIGSLLPTAPMRSGEMEVCGIFSIDNQSDTGRATTSLRAAQRLFGADGHADAVLVRAAEGENVERLCRRLEQELGEGVRATSREMKNSAFYRIMRYEKWGIFFVSALVLVIASLSIVGAVVMLIVEKRDEQLTLRSMGADSAFLRGIFIREGLLISGAGGVAGILAGVGIVAAQSAFSLVRLPAGAFLVEGYPVDLQAGDLAVIFVTFFLVALAVSAVATRAIIRGKS